MGWGLGGVCVCVCVWVVGGGEGWGGGGGSTVNRGDLNASTSPFIHFLNSLIICLARVNIVPDYQKSKQNSCSL